MQEGDLRQGLAGLDDVNAFFGRCRSQAQLLTRRDVIARQAIELSQHAQAHVEAGANGGEIVATANCVVEWDVLFRRRRCRLPQTKDLSYLQSITAHAIELTQ